MTDLKKGLTIKDKNGYLRYLLSAELFEVIEDTKEIFGPRILLKGTRVRTISVVDIDDEIGHYPSSDNHQIVCRTSADHAEWLYVPIETLKEIDEKDEELQLLKIKELKLMVLIEKMIQRYRAHQGRSPRPDGLDEEIFKLFERAKMVYGAKNIKDIEYALKDL